MADKSLDSGSISHLAQRQLVGRAADRRRRPGQLRLYATWAALQNANYYAAPYLSPFYSPCLAANCAHVTLPLIGSWWNLSPAFLILWIPRGFRATCYYYRKAYYRSFFRSPPACAVPDAAKSYTGETRFPFLLQNLHRYFFYLSLVVLASSGGMRLLAFRFPDGFGIGRGHASCWSSTPRCSRCSASPATPAAIFAAAT